MTQPVKPEWYLNTCPDVAAAGMDPQVHYQRYGRMDEGRDYEWPNRNDVLNAAIIRRIFYEGMASWSL